MSSSNGWYVYILECRDQSFYTGVTTDIDRRLSEHNESALGAKYTRARRPVTLVYQETCDDRAQACAREYQIKQMTRSQKLALIQKQA